MEGKFKWKYTDKAEYEKNAKKWIDLMQEWKDADTEFKRNFNIEVDDNNLQLIVEVTSERELNI